LIIQHGSCLNITSFNYWSWVKVVIITLFPILFRRFALQQDIFYLHDKNVGIKDDFMFWAGDPGRCPIQAALETKVDKEVNDQFWEELQPLYDEF
jgi:hypothetical protein